LFADRAVVRDPEHAARNRPSDERAMTNVPTCVKLADHGLDRRGYRGGHA
jgi:hypothetical protein